MKVKAKPLFDAFEVAARSEEQGNAALPTVMSSFDQHFKYETGAEVESPMQEEKPS